MGRGQERAVRLCEVQDRARARLRRVAACDLVLDYFEGRIAAEHSDPGPEGPDRNDPRVNRSGHLAGLGQCSHRPTEWPQWETALNSLPSDLELLAPSAGR